MHDSPNTSGRHARPPKLLKGDIVVTRVARHYALGRMTADGKTQMPIETRDGRSDALSRACVLAGADHRVFLYELAGPGDCVHIKGYEGFNVKGVNRVHGERRLKPRSL